jgi:hypothetical protein
MNEENRGNSEIEEHLMQFSDRVIAHPALDSVFREVQAIVRHPAGSTIVAVVGPTGVGKTTLIRKAHRGVLDESDVAMRADPGHIPIVLVEAPSPDNGSFHWGDFYVRFLEAAVEPMVDTKSIEIFEQELRERRRKAGTFAELRRAVEHCIRYRGTKVVIIDEAQHLTKVPNARRLQDQLDTIKSLASLSGVLFAMVGTYDLLTLLNQNGQLARRTRRIHFPRYNLDHQADRLAFQNILGMFESRLPFPGAGILGQHQEYLYQGCLGCVGTLKDWLRRALAHAVEAGQKSLKPADLEATILDNGSLLTILQEIRDGETRIATVAQESDHLRTMLGLIRPKALSTARTSETASLPRRAVGERKPVRDPLGVAV